MDLFRATRLWVHQIRMAARITKTVPGEQRTISERASYGMVYKISGKTEYRFLSENLTLLLTPGSILYLPEGCTYQVTTLEPGDCIAVNFSARLQLPEGAIQSRPLCVQASSPKLENLFIRLHDSFHNRMPPDARGEYGAIALLYEIFSILCTPVRHSDQGLEQAMMLLRRRLGDVALTVTELAQSAGMSQSYFRKRFTQVYGIPPVRYVLLLRIAQSRKLLTETQLPVSAVAERCGFSDLYYFSRVFTKETGFSPTAYRRYNEI